MGPPQAKDALKECLAMGADAAILLSDRAFGGADTLATSYTLAAAIRKLGNVDLLLCGKQAIDGDTAQVGPEMAEHLGWAQVTYAAGVEIDGDKVKVNREQDEGYDVIATKLPAVITIIKTTTEPRYPTVKGTMKANRTEIPVWTAADLEVDADCLGLNGSPTKVKRIFTPQRQVHGEILEGEPKEAAAALVEKLRELKIV
jgi:electron transfer flavoprotein beta subunit